MEDLTRLQLAEKGRLLGGEKKTGLRVTACLTCLPPPPKLTVNSLCLLQGEGKDRVGQKVKGF